MSLKQAVLKIVERMREEAEAVDGRLASALASYAFMLEMACEAAGDDPIPSVLTGIPTADHRTIIERIKEDNRRKKAEAEEGLSNSIIPCKGGNADGSSLPHEGISPPDGAHTSVGNQVYTYHAATNTWVFDYDMTEKGKR